MNTEKHFANKYNEDENGICDEDCENGEFITELMVKTNCCEKDNNDYSDQIQSLKEKIKIDIKKFC